MIDIVFISRREEQGMLNLKSEYLLMFYLKSSWTH